MNRRITMHAASLLLLAACSTSGPSPAEPDAAPPGDATADAAPEGMSPHPPDGEQPPWDPVWRKKEPANWPTVGPEEMPSCGQGCRLALNGRIDGRFSPPSIGLSGIVEAFGDLYWAPAGEANTYRLHEFDEKKNNAVLFVYSNGQYATYIQIDESLRRVEVINLVTGERKVAYSIEKIAGDLGLPSTALNSKYVFWERYGAGLMARNLQTGEIKIIHRGPVGSMGACTTEAGIWLFDLGEIKFFDQETGEVSLTDDDGAEWSLQVDGTCAASSKQISWIDYRDPPGPGSNYDFTRRGGEVYVKDLESGKVERVTFDSPDAPRAKAHPVVDGTRFVWLEQLPELDPNPDTASQVYSGASMLVRYDAVSKERCRMRVSATQFERPYALIGNRLYAGWADLDAYVHRLVELDLAHPGWEWECGYASSN